MSDRAMLIDGDLVAADSGREFENVNPATEAVIGVVPDGGATEMQRAIAAARRAFDTTDWSRDVELRRRCLAQLQQACREESDEWRQELVAEVGTPIMWTYAFQLDWPIESDLGAPLALMDTFEWEVDRGVREGPAGRFRAILRKQPIGVVALIVPWNFPVQITFSKLGPVIATGNTCVVKPAPDTPFNATRLARIIAEKTDIPPGVVNIVTASDHRVGEVLASSPDVDLVAFTGSTATGSRIMEVAAPNVTKVFLELGGKSPTIVLDDADLASVLPGTVQTCFHAGQGCALPTRLLLPRSRYAESLDLLEAVWANIPYGDPTDMANLAGPLINAKQRDRVLGHIGSGRGEGARILVGGGRPAHLDRGFYVEPTLFVDVEPEMTIAQEEIFGPVLVVIPYEDDKDAIRIANGTPYGLSGTVVGTDVERATAIAGQIRAGTVTVNSAGAYSCDMPFGGFKRSGIGRQWGVEGFDELLELTSLSVPVA